jgi:hypothetical protein
MLAPFALAKILQTLSGAKKNEDPTPNMRGDNSKSHACCFRAGWTYGHDGRSSYSARAKPNTERKHDINRDDYRSDGA